MMKNKTKKLQLIILLCVIAWLLAASSRFWLPECLKSVPPRPLYFGKKYTRRDGNLDWMLPKIYIDDNGNICLFDTALNSILIIDSASLVYDFSKRVHDSPIGIDATLDTMPRKVRFVDPCQGLDLYCESSDTYFAVINHKNRHNSIKIDAKKNVVFFVRSASDVSMIPMDDEQFSRLYDLITNKSSCPSTFLDVVPSMSEE